MDTVFRIFKKSITVKVCSCHLVAFYRKTINALVFGNKFIADVMKTSRLQLTFRIVREISWLLFALKFKYLLCRLFYYLYLFIRKH